MHLHGQAFPTTEVAEVFSKQLSSTF
jgi:hypothetical protein